MSKRRKSVTIRDVAELAEVSQSTVSRVLNASPSAIPISEETKQRVLAAAQKLGYRPNPLARGLRGSSVLLIGVIAREVADPFFSPIISILSTMARANGYNLVLGQAQSSASEVLVLRDILDTRHCDGIIMLGDPLGDESIFDEIMKMHTPFVGLSCGQLPVGITTVNVDNQKGTRLLLEYLRDLGHSKIAFIDGTWFGEIKERRAVYQSFMKENGWDDVAYCVVAERNEPVGGHRAMRTLLSLPEPPTAVFAADDGLAIGALKAAADLGFRVPDQVSVAGFDDIELAQFTIPTLTTVRQPIEELAHTGLQFLIETIEGSGPPDSGRVIRLEPELVVRDSCTPPGGGSSAAV